MSLKKVLLLILDGFGISNNKQGNAVYYAKTTNIDFIEKNFPLSTLKASGPNVGLPKGVVGNSEVGHLTIGAGRIVAQDLVRINKFLEKNKFIDLLEIKRIKNLDGSLHILGLCSDGSVHSSINHLYRLIKDLTDGFLYSTKKIFIHMITDGRDAHIRDSLKHSNNLDQIIETKQNLFHGTVMGRFFAMDRDKRWERTKKALDALVGKSKINYTNFDTAILAQHKNKIFDEFILPTGMKNFDGIKKEDQVIFFNFRSDRSRQLVRYLKKIIKKENLITFTRYQEDFDNPVLFSKPKIKNTLSEVVEKSNLKQLKLAETEKYAHVTYFFNGGRDKKFKNEDRILIQSPLDITTYDEKPQMSVFEITSQLEKNLKKDYSLIVTNFANPDMVGHTGNFEKTIEAVEACDKCIGKIISYIELGWTILLTSDHGNCEQMTKNGKTLTSHTLNPVPLFLISKNKYLLSKTGKLEDIAPTICKLIDINIPNDMTGNVLI